MSHTEAIDPSTGGYDPARLFLGSCLALVATSTAFATVGAVMFSLKAEFVLTNAQVGWIGGAALWGFAISQLVFSPFCDVLGMKLLLRLAFLGHFLGTAIMITAGGFETLFGGALVISMANGLVEAACNPLVAALYPSDKTVKLNQFHVWFPGGIVLAGLAAFGMDMVGLTSWQLKVALILIPTVAYGFLLLGQEFPPTEGVKSGVSLGEMFRATLTTPLMLVMLVCMAITASIELGPNRWVPAVLEAGGMAGILVLVYINGLMAVMRYRAGDVVHRLSPTGILLASAVLSGIGLYWLSYASPGMQTIAAATVFALGVCYFWPVMLGVVSERIPKSGALGLGLMGTVGMATVGLITAPWMGAVADEYAHQRLPVDETVTILTQAVSDLQGQIRGSSGSSVDDLQFGLDAAQEALALRGGSGALPPLRTANALRAVIGSGVDSPIVDRAAALLGPAENYGGLMSFRSLAPFCGILIVIFGLLVLGERRRGGYDVERLFDDGAGRQTE